jgi:hypothetical protein
MNLNAICIGINSRSSNETARYRSLALDFASPLQPFDSRITYSGASARMYFDSTGTLQYAPHNLFTYSNDLSSGLWQAALTASISGTNTINLPATDDYVRNTVAETILPGMARSAQVTLSGSGTIYILITRTGAGTLEFTLSPEITLTSTPTVYTVSHTFAFNQTGWDLRIGRYVAATATQATVQFAGGNLGSQVLPYVPTTTAAVYLPRSNAYQDHDPSTLAPLGFLIEEARTNSIRNNTMQGAVAGSPGTLPTNWAYSSLGTLSTQIVGTGTENGIPYTDVRLFGTTGTTVAFVAFETTTQVVAANGETWTASMFCKLVGGGYTNITATNAYLLGRTALGATVPGQTASTPFTANSTLTRHVVTRTMSDATVGRVWVAVDFRFFSSLSTIDITLRIGLPQLELGAFATSPILTSGAAATRLADVASMTGTNFSSWYNQTEGTFVAKWRLGSDLTSASVWQTSDGTTGNVQRLRYATGGTSNDAATIVGGVVQATLSSTAQQTLNTNYSTAVAYKMDDFARANDGAAATTDLAGTLPSVDRLGIGMRPDATEQLNGHIQSLVVYNKRLPNSTLVTLTS